MSWWGKIIGGAFGYMLGGPLGAVLGVTLGHNLDAGVEEDTEAEQLQAADEASERFQLAFFTATFSIMGHLCKVDGRVSQAEIGYARSVMRRMVLTEAQKETAIRLFNAGKKPDFLFDDILGQLRQAGQQRRRKLLLFLEIQLAAAIADSDLRPSERTLLLRMCEKLGISRYEYQRIETLARREAGFDRDEPTQPMPSARLQEAYEVLRISPESTDDEVKRAYRRLVSRYHPDKLASKKVSEETLKLATQKTHEIRQAYEQIRAARQF
jgi:DnaJ like chaperone protein